MLAALKLSIEIGVTMLLQPLVCVTQTHLCCSDQATGLVSSEYSDLWCCALANPVSVPAARSRLKLLCQRVLGCLLSCTV